MERYVALLRGINVGGKNKISMAELKKEFEDFGFQDVVTYINSGNILFSSDETDELKLKEQCEALILNSFHLNILVTVVSAKDLKSALLHAPSWWGQDEESKHNAIFVLPPATVEEVFREVGVYKPEYEFVDHYGQVIFWSAPVKTMSRTRYQKIVGSSVYDSITIRNANTFRRLVELLN